MAILYINIWHIYIYIRYLCYYIMLYVTASSWGSNLGVIIIYDISIM